MARRLLLATRNYKKLEEMQAILGPAGIEVLPSSEFPEVDEPEEHGETFAENARHKALWYSQHTGLPALADDSGLMVDALGGRPGVRSSRYAATDQERNAKLLAEMADVPAMQRTARFVCAMALADGGAVVAEAQGVFEGAIGYTLRGAFGFGYDPVFVLGDGRHLAELPPESKNRISHRGLAMQRILPAIERHFRG
jgi:XTP/dITP diphosphohydrolase